jgi:two-component system alkaline phosphatase synthesis response regulator PhoP
MLKMQAVQWEGDTVALRAEAAAKGHLRPPVLVADDDSDVRTMVRMLLELDGHTVIEAKDGSSAWEMIKAHNPMVVVADVQMPGLTGLQLCRKVKENDFNSVKVIVYTAGMATREDAAQAGCDGYFLKTDPLPSLREAVRRFYELG